MEEILEYLVVLAVRKKERNVSDGAAESQGKLGRL